ncbi:MAG: hypothetical protein AAGF57_20330 [Pseudomonadota bacterium]
MELFEYIAIAFSMIFSFTVLRLVGGLPYACRPSDLYWPHLLFTLTTLVYVLNAFWAFWSYREVQWTYLKYLIALASPAAQYFTIAVLIPVQASDVTSWRDYYQSVRSRFFLGMILVTIISAVSTTVIINMPLYHPLRAGQMVIFVISVAGLISANAKVHLFLALASLFGVISFGFLVLMQPGALE